ncbi:N-acetylmuramyl-L-alanine amidase, negative regulator of AmpC, AmpD [uncultured Desulfobacterium sp.]|uniref:N-acetylmuramyl-L-alanine amidase, negative regulator of AmpC, AmpD n=1 Tax=uncultured Desulfobacterium sp. TaxID=201089 RepID=A0A445MT01_9BACT|nr:N-acetylmuramyl-L-alanine amidase, negative regulator of AmpC, AmpD [uncultured Desulfobacterium sp.]
MGRIHIRSEILLITISAIILSVLAACIRQQASYIPTSQHEAEALPPETSCEQHYPPSTGPLVINKQLLSLPSPKNTAHEVAPLETLWRISKMYDVPVQQICAVNQIKPEDTLRIGRKLIIPNASALRHVIALYPSSKWEYIVIHHTATDIGNACLIDRGHQDRGYWRGLGYHFLIDNGTLGKGNGQIEVAPRWIKQQNGAHCMADRMNEKAIGIALVGNFNVSLPTEEQMKSLTYLVDALRGYYRIQAENIIGHGEVKGTATDCPGRLFPWSYLRPSAEGLGNINR